MESLGGIVLVDPSVLEVAGDVPEDAAIGSARVTKISPALGMEGLQMNYVELGAGARFRPHCHPVDQMLYYLKGTGVVAIDGGRDIEVPEGSVAFLPKSRPHMHGCTNDGPAIHLSLTNSLDTDWIRDGISEWKHWFP